MITEKLVYITQGAQFDTREEAEAHEKELQTADIMMVLYKNNIRSSVDIDMIVDLLLEHFTITPKE